MLTIQIPKLILHFVRKQVTHLEFSLHEQYSEASNNTTNDKESDDAGTAISDEFIVRIRCANRMPQKVTAEFAPSDD